MQCMMCAQRVELEGSDAGIDPDRVATVVDDIMSEVNAQFFDEKKTVQVQPPAAIRHQARALLQQARQVVVEKVCICHRATYEGGRCTECGGIEPAW